MAAPRLCSSAASEYMPVALKSIFNQHLGHVIRVCDSRANSGQSVGQEMLCPGLRRHVSHRRHLNSCILDTIDAMARSSCRRARPTKSLGQVPRRSGSFDFPSDLSWQLQSLEIGSGHGLRRSLVLWPAHFVRNWLASHRSVPFKPGAVATDHTKTTRGSQVGTSTRGGTESWPE